MSAIATTDSPCPIRFVTTLPTQAIGLLNREFTNRQAEIFANIVRESHDEPKAQVAAVLRRVVQREPAEDEVARGLELMNDRAISEKLGDALKIFCLMALNMNEFFYLQ